MAKKKKKRKLPERLTDEQSAQIRSALDGNTLEEISSSQLVSYVALCVREARIADLAKLARMSSLKEVQKVIKSARFKLSQRGEDVSSIPGSERSTVRTSAAPRHGKLGCLMSRPHFNASRFLFAPATFGGSLRMLQVGSDSSGITKLAAPKSTQKQYQISTRLLFRKIEPAVKGDWARFSSAAFVRRKLWDVCRLRSQSNVATTDVDKLILNQLPKFETEPEHPALTIDRNLPKGSGFFVGQDRTEELTCLFHEKLQKQLSVALDGFGPGAKKPIDVRLAHVEGTARATVDTWLDDWGRVILTESLMDLAWFFHVRERREIARLLMAELVPVDVDDGLRRLLRRFVTVIAREAIGLAWDQSNDAVGNGGP